MIMKKWLSHFAYNQRSRSGWTLSTHLKNTSKSNLIGKKTVTYVPGTFVTLVPGPNKGGIKGDFLHNLAVDPVQSTPACGRSADRNRRRRQ
jgi:hypothetical protein